MACAYWHGEALPTAHWRGSCTTSAPTWIDAMRRCVSAICGAADLLLENLGLARIEETGLTRPDIEAANPRLVHVSVSTSAARRRAALARIGTGGLGDGRNPAARRRRGSPAGQGGARCVRLPRRHGARPSARSPRWHERREWSRAACGHLRCRKSRSRATSTACWCWQFDRRLLSRAGGALNYGRATVRCIWAAEGRLLFPFADDRQIRRAGQPGTERLDGCDAAPTIRCAAWTG